MCCVCTCICVCIYAYAAAYACICICMCICILSIAHRIKHIPIMHALHLENMRNWSDLFLLLFFRLRQITTEILKLIALKG